MSRFPHHFFSQSVGDKLLAEATMAKIELHRLPNSLGEVPIASTMEFELRGSMELSGDGALELLAGLVQEFKRPSADGLKGGVE